GAGGHRGDAIVEPRDGYPTIAIVHVGQDLRQDTNWIAGSTAIVTGMEVLGRTGNPDLLGNAAAQTRGDRGGSFIPHAGVANEHDIRLERAAMIADELVEMARVPFFISF